MDDEQPPLTDWAWMAFVFGLSIGVVLGICLGIVIVIMGDPRE